jgi:hypothetical protein
MHIVADHGAFLEVEPVADGQCTGSTFDAPSVAHLHVFVKEGALATVLVKPWHASFDDGSAVSLGIGTPVVPLDDGGIAFAVDDLVLNAHGKAPSMGVAYPPIRPASDPAKPRFELALGAQGTVAGQTYTAPQSLFDVHRAVTITHPRKDESRFPIQLRCGEVDVVVPDEAVHAYSDPGGAVNRSLGRFVSLTGTAQRYVIPKGTPLSTPAGRRAGTAAEDRVVDVPPEEFPTACFDASVSLSRPSDAPTAHEETIAGSTINLCAPVKSLRPVKSPVTK